MATEALNVKVTVNAIDAASDKIRNVGRSFSDLNVQAFDTAKRLRNIGDTFVSSGKKLSLFVTAPLAAAGGSALKAAADFEQTTIAFTTMLGSAELAKKTLSELARFAAKTPFELREVEMGARQLLAMGSAVEDIIPEMRMLGDISAGLNVPMERLVLNFGQVRVQGKLTGRELRDFSVAGVPLIDALADSMGETREAIAEMVTEGVIGFDDVKKAFVAMTSEGGRFHDLMQDQSKTTAGQFSNLKDELNLLARDLGKELLPAAIKIIRGLIELVGWFKELSPWQRKALLLFGGIALVLGPVLIVLGQLAIALAALTPIFIAIQAAVAGMITFLGVPLVVALMAIISAISVVTIAWSNNWFDIQNRTKNATETIVKNLRDWGIVLRTTIGRDMEDIRETMASKWAEIKDRMGRELDSMGNDARGRFRRMNDETLAEVGSLKERLSPVLEQLQRHVRDRWASWGIHLNIPSWDQVWKGMFTAIVQLQRNVQDRWATWGIHVDVPDIGAIMRRFKSGISRAPRYVRQRFNELPGFLRGVAEQVYAITGGLPSFARAGVVPGPLGRPQMAIVHGGERIERQAPGTDKGGQPVEITVNIGMYAGSETEKRAIAMELWGAVGQVAKSRNQSAEELLRFQGVR